jgi:hypothetical protein
MSSKIYTSVLAALLLFSTSSVFAEVETTSSLRGVVNVPGAVVSATHTPTGTSKTRSASADGAFYLSDLQIGGPYEISVSAAGYRTESLGGIYLVLDKTTDVTVTLVSSDIEEITVTAAASQGSIRMGTGTFLDRDAIDGVPTVNRSIADIAKLDPRVSINTGSSRYSEISVMGANNRFNDFTIDGVSYNDPFGLNANGFGSMRNPIGMEFIDQISVDVTPFDVSRGNTTGGSIASVTKSGSNEFHGSVFFINRDEDDIGDGPDGEEFPEFSEETKGFTLSGPIVKDRLFFFVGYEEFEAASPALYGTVDSNAPIKAETLTTAMADEIKSIAMNRYNYDPGVISSFALPETSEKTIVKLNANINEDHRAVLLYQKDEDLYPRKYNRGETVFSNNWYLKPPEIDRITFSLFSDWSDRLSTKIRFTNYELVEDDHSVGDPYFPESAISVGGDTVYLGGDRYRGANFINIESDYVNFKATYDLGNHVITAGIDLEDTSVYNLFIARYNGEVRFSSIADFEAGTYNYVRFHVPQTGISDVDNVAAMFDIEKTSLFIQDKIYLGDAVLSLGLRYDAVETPDKPLLNPKFLERNGYPNNAAFDYDTIQPRFGFNWDATERLFGDSDRIASATLRGGYGLFAGRIPNVWYSNAYTRSGGLSDYVKVYGWDSSLPSFRCGGTVGPMPAGDPSFFWMGPGSDYCIPSSAYFNDAQGTHPDFEAPSSWRMNLALDLVTVNGYEITVEYNHDDVDQGVFYHDAGLTKTGTLADGRGTYYGKGDYIMTNTDKGGAEAYTFSVRKSFDNGLSVYSAYSSVDAKDVYPLTSSQAESAYGYTQRWDGENMNAARSSFMSDSKLIVGLEYRAQWWGDNETRISALYIRKDGEPYSISFDEPGYNSVTGNSKFYADYSLAYVPSGADDANVVFSSSSVANDVMAHINSTALAKYKGTYAPRNAFTNPDYDRLDIRITQEIPAFRDHKFIVYFDLLNVMNMLDDEDGRVFEYGYNNSRQILVSGTDSEGRFLISGVDDDDSLYLQDGDGQSRWQLQMGLKYRF